MNQYIFEFLGTLVLVLFGDGVCAACSLNKSKAQGGGWVVISLAWGLAVMMGVLDEYTKPTEHHCLALPLSNELRTLPSAYSQARSLNTKPIL